MLGLWWRRADEALPKGNVYLKHHSPYEVILLGMAGKAYL